MIACLSGRSLDEVKVRERSGSTYGDNLSGFANALAAVFPKTENQLCVIHMIRNSTKYVSYKDLKAVMSDLKKIYGSVSEEAALYALEEFNEKWSGKYPQIYKSWEANWSDLSGFFKYPTEMRRLIYTTNRDWKIPARATPHARVFAAQFAAKIMSCRRVS